MNRGGGFDDNENLENDSQNENNTENDGVDAKATTYTITINPTKHYIKATSVQFVASGTISGRCSLGGSISGEVTSGSRYSISFSANASGSPDLRCSPSSASGTANGDKSISVSVAEYFTLSYSSGGGSGSMSSQSAMYTGFYYADSCFFYRTNYVFSHWKGSDGSTYNPGNSIRVTGDFTLTAVWTYSPPPVYTYHIYYYANYPDGTDDYDSKSFRSDTGTTIGTASARGFSTPTGYTWSHWNTKRDGTGTPWYSDESYYSDGLTLYAQWTRNSYTNRYYYRNTSGGQDSTTQTRYYNSTYTLLSSISDDYESNGWSLYAWGSSSSATSGSSPGSTTSSTSTSTISYYAISRRTVSISYNANGGKFSSTPSTTGTQYWNQYGNAYNNPRLSITSAVPTRTGYEFLGWSTSSTATSADYVYGSTYTFSNTYSSSASKTFYAVWEARNPAYYDEDSGFWYVENGKLPQSKVSDSLKSTLSGQWSSLSDGSVYYMGVEELADGDLTTDGGMQSKVYNGNEYVKFNGEYYLVEPIRWRLVYSSSQQEGYAVENTSVLATMAEIVFVGSYSSAKIGVGAGYSAESVTMLLKNQVSDEFLVSESREVEIFGTPKDTTSASGSVFVASSEELANFTTNKNNTTGSGVKAGKVSLSDFVKDYLRATGQGDYYFTRDLGDQLNTIRCLNPVGNRSQAKTQQTLGVQFTIKVTEYACKSV